MATDIVLAVVAALEKLAIPYMLVGSYSSNIYGRPRSTKDADFVVQLGSSSLTALMAELGTEFDVDPQMSFESVTGTMPHIVSHRSSIFKIELFLLSSDEHDRSRFDRRRRVAVAGQCRLPGFRKTSVKLATSWEIQPPQSTFALGSPPPTRSGLTASR